MCNIGLISFYFNEISRTLGNFRGCACVFRQVVGSHPEKGSHGGQKESTGKMGIFEVQFIDIINVIYV